MSNLLDMFRSLSHYQSELIKYNNEDEIHRLLEVCAYMQQQWQAATNDLAGANRIILTYEHDVAQLRVEVKELKGQLVESRSQIAGLIAAKNDIERERATLASQIEAVRDVLREEVNVLPEYSRKKLQFLNDRPSAVVLPRNTSCSAVIEDIDYDRTDDSLDENVADQRQSGGHQYAGRMKRSLSLTRLIPTAPGVEEDDAEEQTPRKRSRDDMHIPEDNGHLAAGPAYQYNGCRSPLNRSFSEPRVNGLLQPAGASSAKRVADLAKLSPATAPGTGRRHTFLPKKCLKAEYCDHCGERIGFAHTMYRCDVCKMQCHSDCCKHALLPCIARGTPSVKNQKGKLVDFVPRDPPMVPNVIVHCVNEIERRGLTTIGLYRVPGSDIQVGELLEKFLFGRGIPNLRQVWDVNILACCVKRFLHQLTEPLIPRGSFSEFVKGGEMQLSGQDATMLFHKAISELPQPNRDTLAYLAIHFQKVATYSHENKMTLDNLAGILAPTIFGSPPAADMSVATTELAKLTAVMKGMLEMSPEYWGRFLTGSEQQTPLFGNLAAGGGDMDHGNANANLSFFGPVNSGISTTPKMHYKTRYNQRKFFNPPKPWK